MNREFKAKWGKLLRMTSLLATVLCFVVAIMSATAGKYGFMRFWLPVTLPFSALPFMVLGYRILPGRLEVRRPLWWTKIPLGDLSSAEMNPEAMKGSLRICGNGGFYSFTGWFWNRRLGVFRVFATNGEDLVVLVAGRKTFVISPEHPEEFLQALGGNGGTDG